MILPTASKEAIKRLFSNLPDVKRDQEVMAKLLEEHLRCTPRDATSLVSILVLLRLIDDKDHTPTGLWWEFVERPQETLRPLLKEVYRSLYTRYADPYAESLKALRDALQNDYKQGSDWAERAARGFCALYEVAHDEGSLLQRETIQRSTNELPRPSAAGANNATLTLQLPATIMIDSDFLVVLRKYI